MSWSARSRSRRSSAWRLGPEQLGELRHYGCGVIESGVKPVKRLVRQRQRALRLDELRGSLRRGSEHESGDRLIREAGGVSVL
jgi:hypothetical protein